ncbi:MAG TPA: hypothetical protein VFN97_14160 [Actinospica sp.]|nr:hypothetical protein [Actinospica sp.]
MDHEITTAAERSAPVGEVEVKLTVAQLRGLLHEAAVRGAAEGVEVRIPYVGGREDQRRDVWPLVFMVSGCVGLAACAAVAATGSQYALLAFFAAVAGWGTAAYQLVFNRRD